MDGYRQKNNLARPFLAAKNGLTIPKAQNDLRLAHDARRGILLLLLLASWSDDDDVSIFVDTFCGIRALNGGCLFRLGPFECVLQWPVD